MTDPDGFDPLAPETFRHREHCRQGLREVVVERAYPNCPPTQTQVARRTRQLARKDSQLYREVQLTTLNNWLQPGGSLPRPWTDSRPLRALLHACEVPDDMIAAWLGALSRLHGVRPPDPPPDPPRPRSEAPDPAGTSGSEHPPAGPAHGLDDLPAPPAHEPSGPPASDLLGDPVTRPVEPEVPPRPRQDHPPPSLPSDRVVATVVLAAVALVLALLLLAVPLPPPLAALPAPELWPTILFVITAVLLLGPGVVIRLRHVPGADVGAVLERWSAELRREWSIQAPQPDAEPTLVVRWRLDPPGAETWPEHLAAARATAPPRGWDRPAELAGTDGAALAHALLDRLPTRRLLLVAESGAGKSVLLRHLAHHMALRWTAGGGRGPHPVLLSLAYWDLAEPLDSWLERQLVLAEPELGRRAWGQKDTVAAEALRTGRLLPVLDGLNEIGDAELRAGAMDALDDWLADGNRPGLVIATQPMPDGGHPGLPRLAVPGHLEAVAADASTGYLASRAGGSVWTELLAGDAAGPVAEALQRPLGVWLASIVFRKWRPGRKPEPRDLAAERSGTAVTTLLLRLLLPAIHGRPRRPGWTLERVRRWLTTITRFAKQDARLGTSDRFLWWELRLRARWVVPLLVALPGGAAVGLVAGLDPRLGMGLGCGIAAGLVGAVVLRWAWLNADEPSDLGPGIACGFIGGSLGALLCGLALWTSGSVDNPVRGLAGSLGAGIAAGAVARIPVPAVLSGMIGGVVVALTANSGAGLVAGVVDGAAAWVAGAAVIASSPARPARALGTPNLLVVISAALCASTVLGVAGGAAQGTWGAVAGVVIGVVGGVAAGYGTARVEFSGYSTHPWRVMAADRRVFWQMLLLGGLTFGSGAAVAVNVPVGIAGFLIIGLVSAASRTAWPTFVVAHWWFALRGRLPLDLVEFLDDGVRTELLRPNGAGYQIRHQELTDHLDPPSRPRPPGPGR